MILHENTSRNYNINVCIWGFIFEKIEFENSISIIIYEFGWVWLTISEKLSHMWKWVKNIRSSHKFVPFFERLYTLRLFTYLSVSWKNVIPLSLYNFFPFFKCIGPLSPSVYKSTREMYTQKSAWTYGMT